MNKTLKTKLIIYILAMLPMAYTIVLVPYKIDPYDFGLEITGIWMTVWFCLTMLAGPIGRMTKNAKAFLTKQPLGLATFTWACLHVAYYIYYNQSKFIDAVADIFIKPSVTIGAVAFVILLALAATSHKAAIRLLKKRWNILHKLSVISMAIAAAHALSFQKVVSTDGGILGLTMLFVVFIRYGMELKQGK